MVEPWGDAFYFAHSYAATCPDSVATSEVSPSRRTRRVLGRTFHPERAVGRFGLSRAMPLARLIPCLDVAHGRVVKGVNFVGLRDVGDPSSSRSSIATAAPTNWSFSTSRRRPKTARR